MIRSFIIYHANKIDSYFFNSLGCRNGHSTCTLNICRAFLHKVLDIHEVSDMPPKLLIKMQKPGLISC